MSQPPRSAQAPQSTQTPQPTQTGGVCVYYRIQLGSFSNPDNARQCFVRLQSAGFSPLYEQYGSLWRVVIAGVKATDRAQFVNRLQAAGFADVWIREEK
jgi:cell division septation protein DedD